MIQEALDLLFTRADELAKKKFETETKEITLHGLPYTLQGTKLSDAKDPQYPTVKVGTLAGLVDAVKLKLVGGKADGQDDFVPHAVVIDSPTTVRVLSVSEGPWEQRHVFVTANAEAISFPGENYIDAEDFAIALQARFGVTPDREKLVRVLANLSGGVLRTSSDDGISQQVSVRAGVALLGEEKIVNPVSLRPYRTFSDVEQPASAFVVRLRQDKDNVPKVALFEADGGLWKRAAIDAIYAFLKGAELGVPVLR